MAVLEVLAGVLLKPVTRFIADEIFESNGLAGGIAESAADLAKERLGDLKKAKQAEHKIEDLALSLIDEFGQFAELRGLEQEYIAQVARDIFVAIDALDLGAEIAKAGRQPARLAPVIAAHLPPGTDRQDSTTGLLVTAFASGLCRIAGELPVYEIGKDQQLLSRLDQLLAGQEAVARDVTRTRVEVESLRLSWQNEAQQRQTAADQNQQQYLRALRRFVSQVQLLGLGGRQDGAWARTAD